VQVPAQHARARESHVDALFGEPAVELGALEGALARVDRALERLPERIERHAGLAIADLAQSELQLALAPEVLDADLLDLVHRRGRLGSCEAGFLEC
jgi:hypothetical protein